MESGSSTSPSTANSRDPLVQSGNNSVRTTSPSPFPLRTQSHRSDRAESVDTRDQGDRIKHGILPDYSFRAKGHVHSVLFNPKTQSTTVHHGKGVSMYHRRKLEQELPKHEKTGDMLKLLDASKCGPYVGVCKSCLKLLNTSFKCFYKRESERRIVSAVFNSWSGEVVTSGPGNITVSPILRCEGCTGLYTCISRSKRDFV